MLTNAPYAIKKREFLLLTANAKQEKKAMKRKILHEKKAFNTSIVLASLNIPDVSTSEQRDEYIEHALLRVEVQLEDESNGVITPHLLQQFLQYAPDKDEVCWERGWLY